MSASPLLVFIISGLKFDCKFCTRFWFSTWRNFFANCITFWTILAVLSCPRTESVMFLLPVPKTWNSHGSFPIWLTIFAEITVSRQDICGFKNGICNAKCLEFWVQRVCLFNFFDSTQKAYLYTISCRFRAIKHRFLFAGEKISHASRVESHRKWRHVGMISDACLIHLVVSSATFFTGCDRPRLNPVNLTGTCEAFLRLVRFDLRC